MKGPQLLIKIILVTTLTAIVVAGILFYSYVYAPNVILEPKEQTHLHIPSGSTYDDVLKLLEEHDFLRHPERFHWLAVRKNYPNRIMAGRYLIVDGMSNNELINLLRSGDQSPVRLTFHNIRTKEELAGRIAAQIEADSAEIRNVLGCQETLSNIGMDTLTIKLLFIPNTYEVFWNTSAEQFLQRMQREYNAFWSEPRKQRAEEIGLSEEEVGVLASIVQSETNKREEMARIAGVYMNRLRRNIPLQADPTVIYAKGDFSIRRVLNRHLEIDSPYNTYMYAGLPPGPINFPAPHVMDAVLYYEDHDYLYFSAKADFSGYHVFAKSYADHLANARKYRRALDERNVFR